MWNVQKTVLYPKRRWGVRCARVGETGKGDGGGRRNDFPLSYVHFYIVGIKANACFLCQQYDTAGKFFQQDPATNIRTIHDLKIQNYKWKKNSRHLFQKKVK